ncbi:MAG: DNA repair protein RecN [Bacteroidetes bacterium]|nr:DNA repair protein RecN [Bacteroidota bacterium]
MLQHLSIQNYALIEALEMDFTDGFTVITGETGAGKSILLGALNLILGKRADTTALMDKKKKCIVEATFRIGGYRLETFFENHDLDFDKQTLIRREINAGGKSRAFINDTPVNLSLLKEIGDRLVNIHSQDDQLLLGDASFQLAVIDSFAKIEAETATYHETYGLFTDLKNKLAALTEQQKQAAAEKDFLEFLYNELEEARLIPGEQEGLEEELEMINHTEEIKTTLYEAGQSLNNDDLGIINRLSEIKSNIDRISSYGQSLTDLAQRIKSAHIELTDMAREIEKLEESVSYHPGRAEEIQDRLNILYQLQSKHRVNSTEALINLVKDLEEKLNNIQTLDQELLDLAKKLEQTQKQLHQQANELTQKRTAVFNPMQKSVERTLHSLGMPDAQFMIKNELQKEPGKKGLDRILFQFNANKGQHLQDLSRVASGGEKSRLMLAIKSLISQKSLLPTIIFDEIDAGVSGAVAEKTGYILASLSKTMQVFAITHLPQIAGLGNDHLMVYKESHKSKTRTNLKRLTPDERIIEIAKLLSGHEITSASVESARHLLKN